MRKKVIIIVISILVVILAVAGIGVYHYITNKPEYALYMTVKDIKKYGAREGLQKHMTDDCWEDVEPIINLVDKKGNGGDEDAKKKLPKSVRKFLKNLLEENMDKIEFDYEIVKQTKKTARINVYYVYDDDFEGTLKITMVRKNHEWLIDDVKAPELNKYIINGFVGIFK